MRGINDFTKGTIAKRRRGPLKQKNVGRHLLKVELLYAFVPSLPFQKQN